MTFPLALWLLGMACSHDNCQSLAQLRARVLLHDAHTSHVRRDADNTPEQRMHLIETKGNAPHSDVGTDMECPSTKPWQLSKPTILLRGRHWSYKQFGTLPTLPRPYNCSHLVWHFIQKQKFILHLTRQRTLFPANTSKNICALTASPV